VSIDDQDDIPLQAVAALVRGALNADIPGSLVAIYEDPRTLQNLTGGKLPALAIYRKSRRSRRESSTARVQDIVIEFQYVLPDTKLDKRANRWPALSAVWDVIETAVLDGKHDAVSDGDEVLVAAATQAQENTATCSNGFAEGGAESYPIFIGQITVTYSPAEVVASDLDDFLEFYAAFDDYPNPDPDTDDDEPLTSDEVAIPQD
jgi:hypothetical protein